MLAPVTHIMPLTTIRRERVLPIPGKVLVRKGQKVNATDTIVEANLSSEHILLDIARGLGVPVTQADQYIKCVAGDGLAEGDIIAGPLGLTRRVVRSPCNGQIILAGGGQVLIQTATQPFQLKAGIPGDVMDLVSDRGAIVETTGSLIQGVWGNGRVDFGVMMVVAKSPNHILTPDQLDVSLRGSVVLAGHCQDVEALKTAEELPVRGLILASMTVSLIPVATQMQFSIILIEGFGQIPMNSAAFKLLSTNDRREVAINAELWDRYAGKRPEIAIPLPSPSNLPVPRETDSFALDQQVRVLRAPHCGEIGTLTGVKGLVTLPSGISAQAAEVRLESGKSAILPLANLEVLE
jgi:hypothetical protein